jgi:hypothetical protein
LNVYGAEGRLVRSANYNTGAASLQIEEDLTDVQAGYYFVELINGTSRIVKPLVKQ